MIRPQINAKPLLPRAAPRLQSTCRNRRACFQTQLQTQAERAALTQQTQAEAAERERAAIQAQQNISRQEAEQQLNAQREREAGATARQTQAEAAALNQQTQSEGAQMRLAAFNAESAERLQTIQNRNQTLLAASTQMSWLPSTPPPTWDGSPRRSHASRTRHTGEADMKKTGSHSATRLLRPGSLVCLCRSCGVALRGVREFDLHRAGLWAERRCLTTPQMAARGLALDPRGFWRLPRREYTGPRVSSNIGIQPIEVAA